MTGKKKERQSASLFFYLSYYADAYFCASSTATATATVAPTIGLLPMPMRPIISTYKCLKALVREINTHLGYISNNAVHAYYSKSIVRVTRFS